MHCALIRITVLKNDEWSYDTYIKSNKTEINLRREGAMPSVSNELSLDISYAIIPNHQ